MTLQQLQYVISTFCTPVVFGKDCSEYAEEVLNYLGEGEFFTFEAKSHNKPLQLNFFGVDSTFVYHTVVAITCEGLEYIVDITAKDKLLLKSNYISYIKGRCLGEVRYHTGQYHGMLY